MHCIMGALLCLAFHFYVCMCMHSGVSLYVVPTTTVLSIYKRE